MIELMLQDLLNTPLRWLFIPVILALYFFVKPNPQSLDLPIVRPSSPHADIRQLVVESTKKYGDRLWQLALPYYNLIVIPPKYLPDLVSVSEEKASFNRDLYVRLLGKYTGIGAGGSSLNHVAPLVRVDLGRHLEDILPIIQDEIAAAVSHRIGAADELTPIPLYGTLLKIVAQVTARVFTGESLCRNEEWLNLIIDYTRLCIIGTGALQVYPTWTHPFIGPFKREIRDIRRALKRAREILLPVISSRREYLKANPTEEPPDDFLTWVSQSSKAPEWDLDTQIERQMTLGLGAINTTTGLLTNTLFDLCTNPSFVEPLRSEWARVTSSASDFPSRQTMYELHKLDSVIHESLRMHPHHLFTIDRHIGSDLRLSNGIVIPKDSFIGVPVYAMNFDEGMYETPATWDGGRYERLKEKEEKEGGKATQRNKWLVTTTNAEWLGFGHGKHACPGRYFAINEVKMMLGHILTEYDFRLEHPENGRPKSSMAEANLTPNTEARVLFRRRK